LRNYLLLPIIALFNCLAANHCAAEANTSLELSLNQLSGASDFQIGGLVQLADGTTGYAHFPVSNLEFPSEMSLFGIGFKARYPDSQITGRISTSVATSTTTMKDSDWGVTSINPSTTPDTLDIYSESKNEGELRMLELRYASIRQQTFGKSTVLFGVGMLLQRYHFDVHDGLQIYPSTGDPADALPGDLLKYDLDTFVPYGFLRLESNTSNNGLSWFGEFAYSPWATVEDEDQHLLRNRVSRGSYDGTAIIYELGAMLQKSNIYHLALSYRHIKITSDGEQRVRDDGIYSHTIYAENNSEHDIFSLTLNVPF
jgi:hypothetical protein